MKPRLRLISNVFSFVVRAQIGPIAIGISCGRFEVGDFFRPPIKKSRVSSPSLDCQTTDSRTTLKYFANVRLADMEERKQAMDWNI